MGDVVKLPRNVALLVKARRPLERSRKSLPERFRHRSGQSADPVTRFYLHAHQADVLRRRLWPEHYRTRSKRSE